MGDIILKRDYAQVQSLSTYRVFINGNQVTTIENDSRKVINLKPGIYKVYVKCLNVKSSEKQIEIKKNDTIRLSCGSNINGIKVAFSWIFMFLKNSIYLKFTV